MRRLYRFVRSSLPHGLAAAIALGAAASDARGQSPIVATGPPSFQYNFNRSFEEELLNRIAVTGEMEPTDLPNLTRLMALESVAMLADIRADMTGTATGNRLEGQVRALWDATEVMSENLGTDPVDPQSLARVQEKFADVQTAYRQLQSSLGAVPGISSRAAAHLRDLSQLSSATTTVMRSFESNLPTPRTSSRQADLVKVGAQARLLSNDIVRLAAMVKSPKPAKPGWARVGADLDEIYRSIDEFQRVIQAPASPEQVPSTFRAIRRGISRTEACIGELGWTVRLSQAWRGIQERLNQINDELGLPRVLTRPPSPNSGDAPDLGPTRSGQRRHRAIDHKGDANHHSRLAVKSEPRPPLHNQVIHTSGRKAEPAAGSQFATAFRSTTIPCWPFRTAGGSSRTLKYPRRRVRAWSSDQTLSH